MMKVNFSFLFVFFATSYIFKIIETFMNTIDVYYQIAALIIIHIECMKLVSGGSKNILNSINENIWYILTINKEIILVFMLNIIEYNNVVNVVYDVLFFVISPIEYLSIYLYHKNKLSFIFSIILLLSHFFLYINMHIVKYYIMCNLQYHEIISCLMIIKSVICSCYHILLLNDTSENLFCTCIFINLFFIFFHYDYSIQFILCTPTFYNLCYYVSVKFYLKNENLLTRLSI